VDNVQVVDTTLAKIMADRGNIDEMLSFIDASPDCLLPDLIPFLSARQLDWPLSQVYLKMHDIPSVLEVWTR
jgi:hypothetical protein